MVPQGPLLMASVTTTTMTPKNKMLDHRRRSAVTHNPPFGSYPLTLRTSHNAKSNVYKHCKLLINYHKKSKSIKVHFNNCVAFRKVMNRMDDGKRPKWYRCNKKSVAWPVPVAKNAGFVSSVSNSLQSLIKQYTLPTVSKTQKAKF
jgi:hypothetical protein